MPRFDESFQDAEKVSLLAGTALNLASSLRDALESLKTSTFLLNACE